MKKSFFLVAFAEPGAAPVTIADSRADADAVAALYAERGAFVCEIVFLPEMGRLPCWEVTRVDGGTPTAEKLDFPSSCPGEIIHFPGSDGYTAAAYAPFSSVTVYAPDAETAIRISGLS